LKKEIVDDDGTVLRWIKAGGGGGCGDDDDDDDDD
jgi:hypothetical protein